MSKKDRHAHKKARQAEKESLRGRTPDALRGDRWSTRFPQPHVPDEAVTGGPRKKKNKSKWCKGHVGKEHVWKFHPWNRYSTSPWHKHGWICERCTKKSWTTPKKEQIKMGIPQEPGWDHWSTVNIWARLAGNPCQCRMCLIDVDDSSGGDSSV